MKLKFYQHLVIKIVCIFVFIYKINKLFVYLVVTYYGSAIDRSKKQPVFQIIMEYVDGLVDCQKND
jgi:hypothetical protein